MHFSYIFFLRNSFFRRISRGITVNLPQYGYFCCNEGWELDRFPSHLQLVGHLRSSRLPKQLASRISPFGCSRTPWNNKSKLVVSDTTILNYYFTLFSILVEMISNLHLKKKKAIFSSDFELNIRQIHRYEIYRSFVVQNLVISPPVQRNLTKISEILLIRW